MSTKKPKRHTTLGDSGRMTEKQFLAKRKREKMKKKSRQTNAKNK